MQASLLAGGLMVAGTPAFAADIYSVKAPVAPTPGMPSPSWTLGIEGSAEFYAVHDGSKEPGDWDDSYYKLSLSHRFAESFVGGVSFEHSFKNGDKVQYYAEATLGYKFKLNDVFTLTPSIGAGYTWRDTGVIKGADSNADIGYYLISLAGDLKVTHQLTWTMFNARYRNGFDATWLTPKLATGLTYDFDSYNAVYFEVGYAWKELDTTKPPYDKLSSDKFNLSLGYKRSF